jgi:hypothetical protein
MSTVPSASARFDVFLSHSSADKPAVELIGSRLRGDGLRPFLDEWNLVPGVPWQRELSAALGESACAAVFFGPTGQGPWHNEEMQVALNRAVRTRDDYRVIPVLLPGSDPSRVDGFLENRTWVDFRSGLDDAEAYQRLIAGIRGIAPEIPAYELSDEPRPYRGLERFESSHQEFFYGRDEDIERLVDRLSRDHFVAVVGASGSGKSSLVRAGLSTEAAERARAGIRDWRRIAVVPGHDALRAVADQVRYAWESAHPGEAGDPIQWVDHQIERFREREDGLLTLLGTLFGDEASPLLLVIDQFEEVFTHRPVAREREASWREQAACFAANLLEATEAQPAWLRIVVTLRADFITRFVGEDFPSFRKLLERRQLWLGPMSEDDVREAIAFPAKRRGAFFEKGLVEMILRDMRGHTAALPLLEESLSMLWAERRGPWLTIDAYVRTGGVGGALATKADALYDPLSADEQRLTQRIFLGLIHLGEGVPDTRRRVAVQDVLGAADRPEQVEGLLQRFSSTGGSRLISLSSTEGAVTAELTHEALIHHWARLRRWLDEGRADLRLHRRIDSAAHHWQELDRPEGSLWRPPDLNLLQAFVGRSPDALTQLQLEFYEASLRAEEQRQREREQQAQEEIEAASQLAASEAQRSEEARGKRRFKRVALGAVALAMLLFVAAGVAMLTATQEREAQRRANAFARTAKEAEREATAAGARANMAQHEAENQAKKALDDVIQRYAQVPIAVSGLATPTLSDGYPFTDQDWAAKVRDEVVKGLDASTVGTADMLRKRDILRKLLDGWNPGVPRRQQPESALQEAARELARTFVPMWEADTDPKSPFKSLQTIRAAGAFLDKRHEAYKKDLRVLRDLVKAERLIESEQVKLSYRDFWRLYWGELLIVEDAYTLGKMKAIGRELAGADNPDSWVRTGRKPAGFNAVAEDLIRHLEKSLPAPQ